MKEFHWLRIENKYDCQDCFNIFLPAQEIYKGILPESQAFMFCQKTEPKLFS